MYAKRSKTTSFKADPELWSEFKETCKMRGVAVCHVLEALMQAWIEGQKATATVIKPVTVNLTMQHVVKRSRRIKKYVDVMYECKNHKWPPPCEHADKHFAMYGSVGCRKVVDWVKLEECWRCFLMGLRQ